MSESLYDEGFDLVDYDDDPRLAELAEQIDEMRYEDETRRQNEHVSRLIGEWAEANGAELDTDDIQAFGDAILEHRQADGSYDVESASAETFEFEPEPEPEPTPPPLDATRDEVLEYVKQRVTPDETPDETPEPIEPLSPDATTQERRAYAAARLEGSPLTTETAPESQPEVA